MKNKALLVVDVQTALIHEKPYQYERLLENLQRLLKAAREKGYPIIYVRHNGCWGDELEPNTPGWEIEASIQPHEGETIIDKSYNSAFKNTNLHELLQKENIKELIITGLQTEFCIDTTVKVAFEFGYDIIIPKDCTSTYHNEFMSGHEICRFYERNIWANRFAKIVTVEQVIGAM